VDSFLDFLWLIIVSFAFVAYLIVMFQIVVDLFRDKEQSGVVKAIWIIALIFLPLITAIIYLIARGNGMAQRQAESVQQAKASTDAYIRDVAGRTPTQEIADAKALLDAGTITPAEYEQIKAKALA
jgi:SNF family Na+-dependent transporter